MHEKQIQTKKRWSTGGQPGTKSACRPEVKPRIQSGSNACPTGFVPPPVYIAFRLFVLLKKCSGQFCSMPWKVRGTVVSEANPCVGVPSCPVPPRPAVPPCAAPSRRARGMFGFWIRQVEIHMVGSDLLGKNLHLMTHFGKYDQGGGPKTGCCEGGGC